MIGFREWAVREEFEFSFLVAVDHIARNRDNFPSHGYVTMCDQLSGLVQALGQSASEDDCL